MVKVLINLKQMSYATFTQVPIKTARKGQAGAYRSGGSRGGSGGSNEPPLEPKLFHFHGEFQELLVKLHKLNPPQLI